MEEQLSPPSRPMLGTGGFSIDSDSVSLLARASELCAEVFGYATLRAHQTEVLKHVLAGHDCLAVLPTGAGKSLCYALPALLRPGLVLVVSPLIALIRDQVQRFQAVGIACASLDSMQTAEEKDGVWQQIESGFLKLLFVSPERLARYDFREKLLAMPLQMIAIDEAHCISQWGQHFRPDYRLLGEYLSRLNVDQKPLQKLALTATATSKVRDDIATSLRLLDPAIVWGELKRENLTLKVVRADKVTQQLTAILQLTMSHTGPGIIYTPTRKSAREIHRMLSDAGLKAGVYHAGLTAEARGAAQRAFMAGRLQVMVATHAFGMGIDKADIRFVFHAGLPGSIEQYIQEIGRAGRDGKPAFCCLVYGPRDYHVQKFMIDKNYPEVSLLRSMLDALPDLLQGSPGRSERALIGALSLKLMPHDEAELVAALQVLCRDGLLAQFKVSGGGYGEHVEVLIGEGDLSNVGAWLLAYPERKAASLAKLQAMRHFAEASGDRLQILDAYFHQA